MTHQFGVTTFGPILISFEELAHVERANAPILPEGDRCYGERIVKKRPTLPIIISNDAHLGDSLRRR